MNLYYNPYNGFTCPDATIEAHAHRLIEEALEFGSFPHIGQHALFVKIIALAKFNINPISLP